MLTRPTLPFQISMCICTHEERGDFVFRAPEYVPSFRERRAGLPGWRRRRRRLRVRRRVHRRRRLPVRRRVHRLGVRLLVHRRRRLPVRRRVHRLRRRRPVLLVTVVVVLLHPALRVRVHRVLWHVRSGQIERHVSIDLQRNTTLRKVSVGQRQLGVVGN